MAHRVARATRGQAAAVEVAARRTATARIASPRALVHPLHSAGFAMRHGEATRRRGRTWGVILGVPAGTGAAIARAPAGASGRRWFDRQARPAHAVPWTR